MSISINAVRYNLINCRYERPERGGTPRIRVGKSTMWMNAACARLLLTDEGYIELVADGSDLYLMKSTEEIGLAVYACKRKDGTVKEYRVTNTALCERITRSVKGTTAQKSRSLIVDDDAVEWQIPGHDGPPANLYQICLT